MPLLWPRFEETFAKWSERWAGYSAGDKSTIKPVMVRSGRFRDFLRQLDPPEYP